MFEHVFYLYAVYLSEFERVCKNDSRLVGMNVHFHHVQIAYNEHAVAYRHEIFAETVYIRLGGFLVEMNYEKFGAVSEFDFSQIVVIEMRLFVVRAARLSGVYVIVERDIRIFLPD